ncbi:MAG: hypothetical protein REI96_19030 [Flavobacterium nitrogenifigens]|uniref:hypothetical protein n=1 Tax=Flavobacterium nitrogenifigens TaxID=1617283 RepID=UPI002809C3DD|nr:hypothetical protein [Flavobacterium nitrogenifigens]MDQ8014551.1 hypothetical protein [Flavobacterium nitrogenifigens]
MKYSIIFFLIFSIISCDLKGQSIDIPGQIEVSNIQNKINVKGTKILIDNSGSYKYFDELKRFQKDSKNYFQIIEIPNQDYFKVMPNVINKINELEKQGGKLRIKKEFKLGVYNAYFALAPQGMDSEQIILGFGDSSFSVLVMGIFENNEKSRNEIVKLVLSTYYDKNMKITLGDNLLFNLQLEDSKFKLSNVVGSVAFYTINNEQLLSNNPYANNFIVSTLPNDLNDFNLKKYSDNLISKYQNNAFKEKNIDIEIISEQNYKKGEDEIVAVEMLGEYQGKKLKMFQYLKQTTKGVILFVGTDISKNYVYFKEFKQIADMIKLK